MQKLKTLVVAGLMATTFVGCQLPTMKTKSRLSTGGDIITTNTVVTVTDGVTNITQTVTFKSPAAGDLELKGTELRESGGVNKARATGGRWFPNYSGNGAGMTSDGVISIQGYGGR